MLLLLHTETTSTNSFIADSMHKPPKLAFSCITPLRGHVFLGVERVKNVKIVGQVHFMGAMVHGLPLLEAYCSAHVPTH